MLINYKKLLKNVKYNIKKLTANKGLVWELTKLKIRSFSIPYCIKKHKEQQAYKLALDKDLELLQEQLDQSQTKENIENFTGIKNELEQIEMHETQSRMFLSKAQWTENGEKKSKYFLNLEK